MHYDWSYWHFDKVGTSSEPFLDASLYPCIILGETLSGPRVPSYLSMTLQYSPRRETTAFLVAATLPKVNLIAATGIQDTSF
jgi:hypothetical protein